jgi:two-component sensor histidine kinase/HPt (histidine-containing phosphotransfer) domain-containing protein
MNLGTGVGNGEKKSPKTRKERTIRSETTKVFFGVFGILLAIGAFSVYATQKGTATFEKIHDVYYKELASDVIKHTGLEIIGIYYQLGSDQDLDILVKEIQRYDGLAEKFEQALSKLKLSASNIKENKHSSQIIVLTDEVGKIFYTINYNSRAMTINLMEGKKKESLVFLKKVYTDIDKFKAGIDKIDSLVESEVESEAGEAKNLLNMTTRLGILFTVIGIILTLVLIFYLMNFLSISLLPISNLMHNMRQAVFSIDKSLKVISPVSNHSSKVFNQDIVEKNFLNILFEQKELRGESATKTNFALGTIFGGDEVQWILSESKLPSLIVLKTGEGNKAVSKVLKLTYTPLWSKLDTVENIMIVAEDVTELERYRKDAQKKEREIDIVKALIEMHREDIEPYLIENKIKLAECRQLLQILDKDIDKTSRELLFRILHTLKGNARVYGFDNLSELFHSTEAAVVELSEMLDSEDSFITEPVRQIIENLANAEIALAFAFKIANKIYGISNPYMRPNGTANTDKNDLKQTVEVPLEMMNILKNHLDEMGKGSVTGQEFLTQKIQTIFGILLNLPLKTMCLKLLPMVQDLAIGLEKDVEFSVRGDEVYLNKEKSYSLRDALVHLIRNAMDHGIETAAERAKLNKNAKSLLEIQCHKDDTQIHVCVRDDGRGINSQLLVEKALSKGLIKEVEVPAMTEEDKIGLIFRPGFSTKDQASMTSGRGVGMDAVKNIIEKMGGNIKVKTEVNKGTEFNISFPL